LAGFKINPIYRLLTLSFLYALFFGFDALTGGYGDPGFAIPAPVLVALIGNPIILLSSDILFLIFWWSIIFIIKYIIYRVQINQSDLSE
jgi:hypothetical protein